MTLRSLKKYFINTTFEEDEAGYLFISDDVLRFFEIVVICSILGTISSFAVICNAVSMYIFLKQVMMDSMSVGLFALSFTDFGVSLIELASSTSYLLKHILNFSPTDMWAMAYVFFGWSMYEGYLISNWITSMISIERCFCVVSPFKVKLYFNRARCVMVVVIIYVTHLMTFVPVYVVDWMQCFFVEPPNSCDNCTDNQRLYGTIYLTDLSHEIETISDIIAGLFLFLASQMILIVSSIWMTYSLKVSSAIRNNPYENIMQSKGHQLTTHEKKLVKLVLSLAVLQTLCNLPQLAVTLFYYSYPDIYSGDLNNFRTMIYTIAYFFNHICCTSNTFCYYFLNSSYRRVFRQIFGLRSM